jgi:hypothetical protein
LALSLGQVSLRQAILGWIFDAIPNDTWREADPTDTVVGMGIGARGDLHRLKR